MALFKEKAKKLLADMRTARNRGTCTFVTEKSEEEKEFISHVKSVLGMEEGQPGTSCASSEDQDMNNNESCTGHDETLAEKFRQLALQAHRLHQDQRQQKDFESAVDDEDPVLAVTDFRKRWNASYRNRDQQSQALALTDFLILRTLGRGAFGHVVLVQYRTTGQFYAMKVIEKEAVIARDNVEGILNEKRTLQSIQHPFLVQLQMHFQDSTNLYMIMEFVGGGDLFFHLKRRHRFTFLGQGQRSNECHALLFAQNLELLSWEKEAQFYGGQIVLALEYLHCMDIVYRDLKPENILIASDGYIKITDFGSCKRLKKTGNTTTMFGTPDFMAPEIFLQRPYNKSVDYWALGILLYEMVHGESPFRSNSESETYEKILSGRIKFAGHLSGALKHLIANLLKDDPTERYGTQSADDIKNHTWFGPLNWKCLLHKQIEAPFVPKLAHRGDSRFFDKFEETLIDHPSEYSANAYKDVFRDF